MAFNRDLNLLLSAERSIDYNKVEETLEEGANPLKGGTKSPLYKSLQLKSPYLLELLLKYITIDQLLSQPNLLHYSCAQSSVECVKLLLEAGYNSHNLINALSIPAGNTPLMVSLITNNTTISLCLLVYGADPNISNTNGVYPVHLAAKNNDMEMLQSLKEFGADFNVQDNNNNTPLHYVTNVELLDYLVFQTNIDPFIENIQKLTAKSLADIRGNTSVVIALRDIEKHWKAQTGKGKLKYILYIKNIIDIKLAIIVISVCAVLAWFMTVYIHQRHPFQ